MSRIPKAEADAVLARSGGHCECCGSPGATCFHHRRPRGMGGGRRLDTDTAANLAHLHDECHRYVHAHPQWARARGLLLRQSEDPALVSITWPQP